MTIGAVALPFACGFEMGSIDLVPDAQQSGGAVNTGTVHTGSYSWALGGISWYLATTETDVYVSLWHYSSDFSEFRVRFHLSSGEDIDFRMNGAYQFDAYVDSTKVADGTVLFPINVWKHLEFRLSSANAGGRLQSWIEGVADIDYTGDTQPGTSDDIEYIRIYKTGGSVHYVDDIHFDSSRLYDRRVVGAVPTSDNTAQFTASGGGSNYADVDELGPDGDTSYVSTSTDAQKDLYGHGGVDLSDYTTPFWVTVWARGRKTVANGDQMRLVLSSNGTEQTGSFENLYTTYQGYFQMLLENDPDTAAAWANQAAINAALIGIESNIP
jgi:hypothetical protein